LAHRPRANDSLSLELPPGSQAISAVFDVAQTTSSLAHPLHRRRVRHDVIPLPERSQMKSGALRSSTLAATSLALAVACGNSLATSPASPTDGGGSSGGPASAGSSSGASGSGSGSSSGTGSSSGASGSGSGGGDASASSDATTTTDSAAGEAASEASSAGNGREVLVWTPTYLNFAQTLTTVTTTTPKAFTEVSPDFYKMNSSLPPSIQGADSGGTTFSGLSIAQVASQVHGAGMKLLPLMYGPDDSYYQTFLSDSGAQSTFIAWLVSEAQTNQYDGWNIDWEPGSVPYPDYGTQYVTFLSAAKAALNAKNLLLTVDLGGWYISQCGHGGGIDLTQIGPAVDVAIIEDYAGGLGPPNPLSACPTGTPAATVDCAPNNYFGAQLNLMCDVGPASAVNIGLINGKGGTGANPFLPMALDSIGALGFTQVAVWPDEGTFLTSTNIPGGGTWYSLLAQFLAH
jgi:hypothetical protein